MKKSPLRRWTWTDPIYDQHVVLLCGDWKPALAWMDRTFDGVTEREIGGESLAKTIAIDGVPNPALVFWFPRRIDLRRPRWTGIVAHEAFHGAMRVLGGRGMRPGLGSEEGYAYYVTWLVEQITQRLQ